TATWPATCPRRNSRHRLSRRRRFLLYEASRRLLILMLRIRKSGGLMRYLLLLISAVLRTVLATIGGMLIFVWMVLFAVFVVPAVVLFVLVMGALLIVACAGLAFWVFTGDPNALRGFFVACLFGGAPFGAFAL